MDLVGVLTGDVFGTYVPSTSTGTKAASTFTALSAATGAPLDQWGVVTYTAAKAVAGSFSAPIEVVDTAANVASNLVGLSTLQQAGNLSAIYVTDATLPTISLTAAQVAANQAVLASIHGRYATVVSASAGVSSLSLAVIAGAVDVTVAANSASVSSPPSAATMTFATPPGILTLGAGATTIHAALGNAAGVEEISGFQFGLDLLQITLNGQGLQAFDTSIDGQHAVFLAGTSDVAHGVVLLGLSSTLTAAGLLSTHTTISNGVASIS
jgi:hypothetical protein